MKKKRGIAYYENISILTYFFFSMTEIYKRKIEKKYNKLIKNNVKVFKSNTEIISFFKTIKKNPKKTPNWLKEITNNDVDISNYVVCIYKTLSCSSTLVYSELQFNTYNENDVISYIQKIFENNQ